MTDPEDGHAVRTGEDLPEIAVDNNTGSLYVVWQDSRFTGRDQVALSKSEDGGLSWSPTKQISTVGGTNQAFTPIVRVADDGDENTDGTVAVMYYDFRNNTSAPGLPTDVWLAHSHDGGATFTEQHVYGSFDMENAPVARGCARSTSATLR